MQLEEVTSRLESENVELKEVTFRLESENTQLLEVTTELQHEIIKVEAECKTQKLVCIIIFYLNAHISG